MKARSHVIGMVVICLLATACKVEPSRGQRMHETAMALQDYAYEHGMRYPGSLSDVPSLRSNDWVLNHVELVFTGKIHSAACGSTQILIREKEAGQRFVIVTFLDGHSEMMAANNGPSVQVTRDAKQTEKDRRAGSLAPQP